MIVDAAASVEETSADARTQQNAGKMPDIAKEVDPGIAGTVDLVGMSDIEVPVRLAGGTVAPARADAFVSLDDPAAKGIHMSRLFLALQEVLGERQLNVTGVEEILWRFVDSHQGLSSDARVALNYDLMLRRPALKSQNVAWRSYPVGISGHLSDGEVRFQLDVQVTYSSTCPCSAALARQLIQAKFDEDFADRGAIDAEELRAWLGTEQAICATPHSQRSHADCTVILHKDATDFDHEELIDLVEAALSTPVQAAVKREDEQEFARLNGQNLMFCEDAGRRLKAALDKDKRIADFRVRASHMESLHPHDAVSIITKGLPNGLKP